MRATLSRLACLVLLASFLSSIALAYQERTVSARVPYSADPFKSAESIRITGILWLPDPPNTAPYPLAIFSHGSQASSGEATYPFDASQFSAFLDRGYAVYLPIRKGFNRKGSARPQADANIAEPLSCGVDGRNAEAGVHSALADNQALFEALKNEKIRAIDFGNITLFGHSRGGFLSVAWAAQNLKGVRRVLNFSGGWQTDCLAFNTTKFAEFAARTKVPVLSFYGAYDSAWPRRHIDENLEALNKNGRASGTVFQSAGHNLFEANPDLWVPIVFGATTRRGGAR